MHVHWCLDLILCIQYTNRAPVVGPTWAIPTSCSKTTYMVAYSHVHAGYPPGMLPGSALARARQNFLSVRTGGRIPSPAVHVRTRLTRLLASVPPSAGGAYSQKPLGATYALRSPARRPSPLRSYRPPQRLARGTYARRSPARRPSPPQEL